MRGGFFASARRKGTLGANHTDHYDLVGSSPVGGYPPFREWRAISHKQEIGDHHIGKISGAVRSDIDVRCQRDECPMLLG